MTRIMVLLILAVAGLVIALWTQGASKDEVRAHAPSAKLPVQGVLLVAPVRETSSPTDALSKDTVEKPPKQVVCGLGEVSGICATDRTLDAHAKNISIDSLLQMQAADILGGNYGRVKEYGSTLIECTALYESAGFFGDPWGSVSVPVSEMLLACDIRHAYSLKMQVRKGLLEAARSGSLESRYAYAEYLAYEFLEAMMALYRAESRNLDQAPFMAQVLSSQAELRNYLGTGAIEVGPGKARYLELAEMVFSPD